MKKNRLIFILSVGIVCAPTLHAQSLSDAMEDDESVTKQELESLLTEKMKDEQAPEASAEAQIPEEVATQAEEQATTVEETIQEKEVEQEAAPALEQVATQQAVAAKTIPEQAVEQSEAKVSNEVTSVAEQPSSSAPALPAEDAAKSAPKAEVEKPQSVAQPVSQEAPTSSPAPAPAVEQKTEESLLDTIDIEEGGNWVLKRKALQDTVRKIEDINAIYDDIRDTNIVFLQGINTVDVLFTQFTYDVGLDLGKVDQLVHDVSQHFQAEREEAGDLSEEERELLVKAQERKKEIEQLRLNIYDIWQAFSQLKEARALNDEQIIEADRLRKQAWRNFRMIERVLNEEKAEELYHETVQLFETMQASYRYLQTRLIPHFEQSIKTIQDKMQLVKQQAEELQKQGVLLKKEAVEVDRKEQAKEALKEEQAPAQTGWFANIKNILWAPFRAIGSLWSWVTGSSQDMSQYLPEAQQAEQHLEFETKHPDEI